jgi:pimeloyl-ACP methyl ester carboxylesterase
MANRGVRALAGAAVGVGAGLVAQHQVIKRRRRNDPEGGERFGSRRGERSRTIQLPDGAATFIEEVGPSAPRGAVFVHGSVLRTDAWHYQMPGLGGHRLVFYDLRGHGLSIPKGDAELTILQLAQDLEAVLDDCGLEETVIVGHSVGGMTALELCVRRPELMGDRIKGLVLLNTTSRPPMETIVGGTALAKVERYTRRPLDALGDRAAYVQRLRKILRPSDTAFMAVSVAAFGPSGSARQIDFTYDMLVDTQVGVIFDLMKAYRGLDVVDGLGGVNVPVLIVSGTHDRLTVPSASEELAEHLPKAELKVLERCGHMSMLERHREINRLLTRFLDDHLGAPENR